MLLDHTGKFPELSPSAAFTQRKVEDEHDEVRGEPHRDDQAFDAVFQINRLSLARIRGEHTVPEVAVVGEVGEDPIRVVLPKASGVVIESTRAEPAT